MPLFMLGYAARVQGEREEGKQLLQRSLLISREFDDRWGMAMGLAGLSQIADEGAHYKVGKQLRQESLALFRQIGDRWGIAWMLSETSRAALWRGALEIFTDPGHLPVEQRYQRLEWAASKLLGSIPYLPQ